MPRKIAISLTPEQREQIARDMDQTVEMLTEEEVEYLAGRLRQKFDIPFLPAGGENTLLTKLVRRVDRYLYTVLPNELYGLVQSRDEGISDEDASQLAEIIITRANTRFELLYLPESTEQAIFRYLARIIVDAMRRDVSILRG